MQERLRRRARAAADLGNLAPSRRDFSLCLTPGTGDPELVPIIQGEGGSTALREAQALDEAGAAALAVAADPTDPERSDALLRALRGIVDAPLFSLEPRLDLDGIHRARLAGADAVLLPAPELGADACARLAAGAGSVHMTAVIEVTDRASLELALALRHAPIAVHTANCDLLLRVPAHRMAIALCGTAEAVALVAGVRERLSALILPAGLAGSGSGG